jgi:hypothetical protein
MLTGTIGDSYLHNKHLQYLYVVVAVTVQDNVLLCRALACFGSPLTHGAFVTSRNLANNKLTGTAFGTQEFLQELTFLYV